MTTVVMGQPARVLGSPAPFLTTSKSFRRMLVVDREFGGRGTITGTVKEDKDPVDLPMRRRVRLYRENDGSLVDQTFSDEVTGVYVFENVNTRWKYTAIAYDHLHHYRASIADNLTPV